VSFEISSVKPSSRRKAESLESKVLVHFSPGKLPLASNQEVDCGDLGRGTEAIGQLVLWLEAASSSTQSASSKALRCAIPPQWPMSNDRMIWLTIERFSDSTIQRSNVPTIARFQGGESRSFPSLTHWPTLLH
jgi:hypothetical protein